MALSRTTRFVGHRSGIQQPVTAGGGAATYRTTVLSDSPISYWRLGESSGTVAADEQAVNAGTYLSTVTLGATSLLTSDANTALSLPGGPAEYLRLKTTKLLAGLTNWTIEFWIKRNGASTANGAAVYCERGSSGNDILKVTVGSAAASGNFAALVYRDDAGTLNTVTSGTTIVDNAAHHIVVTKSGTAVTIYRDGASDGSGTLTATNTFTDATIDTRVGSDPVDASSSQAMIIDEVAIYNTALSSGRVSAHYAAR